MRSSAAKLTLPLILAALALALVLTLLAPGAHATPAHATPAHATPAHATPAHATPAHAAPARVRSTDIARAQLPAACPTRAPQRVVSHTPGAQHRLVPVSVTGALLCRYGGAVHPAHEPVHAASHAAVIRPSGLSLVGQARLSGPAARALAAQFDRLGRMSVTPRPCPLDIGMSTVAYFMGADGTVEPVSSQITGCASSSNGSIERAGVPQQMLTLTAER